MLKKYYLNIIFFISFLGTAGSLYYSEVELLTPCNLCWYQRILLYPIAIVAFVAILRKDWKAYLYILPLSTIGMFVAVYNYLLQKTDWFETLGTCSPDNPCSKIDMEYLGFITIPFLSFLAFFAITLTCLTYIYMKGKK